jgi:hypothetical protein
MNSMNENPKLPPSITEQLHVCVAKSIKYANDAMDAKAVDQAARALEVCKQAMELLLLVSEVDGGTP